MWQDGGVGIVGFYKGSGKMKAAQASRFQGGSGWIQVSG